MNLRQFWISKITGALITCVTMCPGFPVTPPTWRLCPGIPASS
jgi:hypothetical protein